MVSMQKHAYSMVKKALLSLSGLTFVLSSCTESSVNFSGTLAGVDSDTLLVFVDDMKTQEHIRKDTVPMYNGKFELQLPATAAYVRFVPKPKSPNSAMRMISGKPIMFFPGDKLTVEGSVDHYRVSGSELYDDLAKCKGIEEVQQKITGLNQAFMRVYKEQNKEKIDSLKGALRILDKQLKEVKFEAIKANPNSMASAFLSADLNPEQGLEAIRLLSERVKKGPMASYIEKAVMTYNRRLISEKAKLNVVPGNQAPDFKLKTIEGNEVTLASFKGKHLLVDFWGTWCGWCVKGIPDMKKYYAKYNKQIEFLGVDCRDTEEKWRAGVAQHQLPWVNVQEGESQLSAHYAVPGYPTKVLVDPEGKILKVFVGESPELYQMLDELFGK